MRRTLTTILLAIGLAAGMGYATPAQARPGECCYYCNGWRICGCGVWTECGWCCMGTCCVE